MPEDRNFSIGDDEAAATGSADSLKVLCHVILSRWADRHEIAIDPVELASLFIDSSADDLVRLERAVKSLNKAAARPMRRSAEPTQDPVAETPPAVVQDTARIILQSATQLFLEKGYEVSLDEIARVAGVTKPTIYSYFQGKKELFRSAMIGLAEEMSPVIKEPDPNGDLREELLQYARSFRAIILSERSLLAYRVALMYLHEVPDVGRLMGQKAILRTNRELGAFFKKAIALGRIRDVDPYMLSEYFFAATAGQSRTRILTGLEPGPPGHGEAYLELLVDCFLGGVQVGPGSIEARQEKSAALSTR